jgi:hypothetical protein
MTTNSRELSISSSLADRLGILASALCIIHCAVTPILLSASAAFAQFLPGEEHTHRSLAVIVAALGAIAIGRGLRAHRRVRVASLMAAGLFCIFTGAFYGDRLASHGVEVAVTFVGSMFMICAHRLNHTFCRDCRCVAQA